MLRWAGCFLQSSVGFSKKKVSLAQEGTHLKAKSEREENVTLPSEAFSALSTELDCYSKEPKAQELRAGEARFSLKFPLRCYWEQKQGGGGET